MLSVNYLLMAGVFPQGSVNELLIATKEAHAELPRMGHLTFSKEFWTLEI